MVLTNCRDPALQIQQAPDASQATGETALYRSTVYMCVSVCVLRIGGACSWADCPLACVLDQARFDLAPYAPTAGNCEEGKIRIGLKRERGRLSRPPDNAAVVRVGTPRAAVAFLAT